VKLTFIIIKSKMFACVYKVMLNVILSRLLLRYYSKEFRKIPETL